MRCLSCDCELNDREAVRKVYTTGEYLDLCDTCFHPIKSDVVVTDYDYYATLEGRCPQYDNEDEGL